MVLESHRQTALPKLNLDSIGLRWRWEQFREQTFFKYDLQKLSESIGTEIRIAHYPPYCSKYNPIERRFFPHVGRACAGMLFDTVDRVVELMRRTSTTTGLKTTVNVIRRLYEIKRNATDEMKQQLRIKYDEFLSKWNYVATPEIGH